MEKIVRDAVIECAKETGIEVPENFVIEHPSDLSHGDYATNIALITAQKAGSNPREIAEKICEEIKEKNYNWLSSVEVAGPGFINFTLSTEFFKGSLTAIEDLKENWGRTDILKGQRVMVEYTQPNPFKVFHIGHLMSNTIGESLSRLVEFSGADVFRANYQGDVGLHIGKTMWGLKELGYDPTDIPKVGEAYAYAHEKYEEDETAKAEIVRLTKAVYAEDPEIMDMYTKGREASLSHFDELYKRLGSKFDRLFFESETWKKGKELVEEHMGDVFEESDGAIVYKGEQDGFHTRVFINSEGVTTYEAKDVGLAYLKRNEWEFDTSITTTAVEQDQYFKVVFSAVGKIDPWFKGKLQNVAHGMMMLSSGKMSSRKGNAITGESMIDDARDAVLEKMRDSHEVPNMETVADQVGIAALKYLILRQSLGKNITYDLERALSFEGDSGPYLQYTYARSVSVLEKAEGEGVIVSREKAPENPYEVERMLYRFPEVVELATKEHEPHHVVVYLTELASAFNTFYAHEKIADPNDEFAPYKAAVTDAARQTLKNGLWLLGIKTPEKM